MAKTTDDNLVELNEMSSRSMIQSALQIGEVLASDEPTQDLLHGLADAGDTAKRGPVATLLAIKPLLEKAKKWDGLPVPNSSSGNNPGKWTSAVPGAQLGTTVNKTFDFYREAIKALPEVKAMQDMIEELNIALNSKTAANAKETLLSLDPAALAAKKQQCQSRINTILRNVKQGIMVQLQMDRIAAEFSSVKCGFIKTATDKARKKWEIIGSPQCIKITEVVPDGNTGGSQPYDATRFLSLDLDLAAANGGGYHAIIKSGAKKAAEVTATQVTRITKYDQFVPAMYEVAAYIGDSDHYETLRVLLRDPKRNAAHKNDLVLVALDKLKGDLVGLLSGMDGTITEASSRVEAEYNDKQKKASK